jgi:hypothetical protein
MELDAAVDVASRAYPVVVPSDRATANSHPIVKVICNADAETVTWYASMRRACPATTAYQVQDTKVL